MQAMILIAESLPDPTSLGWWLQNFGPLGLVLFVAGMGLWKLAVFVKPYFIDLATGHVALMDSLAKTQHDQCDRLSQIATVQTNHTVTLSEIHRHTVPRQPLSTGA